MGASSSRSDDDHHRHNHHHAGSGPPPSYQYPPPPPSQQQQQPVYSPYAQTRVYAPPQAYAGHQGYNNGQYYGQYGAYPPYQPGQQQPYAPGQFGQPPYPQAPPGPPGGLPHGGPPSQEVQTTQTIKNQVNLKKTSIKVAPVEGNPSQYTVTFSFDATAACRVSVFLNSKDDAARNRIVSPQAPLAVIKCDKGIHHQFPEGGAPPVLVPASALKDWSALPSDKYAVVVRLEALTDEGRAEGRTLDSVDPAGDLPPWVQSQTTYAKMHKLEDGSWSPVHVLQKLCFKGKVFELQEIYGMEQGRPAEAVDGFDEVEGNECVICMSAPRDTTALPCRHMCMCHTCANELKTQTNKCPICRNVISSLLHIKIAAQQGEAAAGAAAAGAAAAAAAAK